MYTYAILHKLATAVVIAGQILSVRGQFGLYNSTSFVNLTVSLSTGCQAALTTSVKCDSALLTYATVDYAGEIDDTVLTSQLCPQTCADSLSMYHDSVASACVKDPQPWPGQPATYFGDLLWAYQNQTCLKDGATGVYCTNYFANLTFPSGTTSLQDLPHDEICSPCFQALLVNSQSSGFSNYDDSTATAWAAIQSACGTKHPTQVPTPPASLPYAPFGSGTGINATTGSNTTCLSGNHYTVVSGDNCQKIAAANSASFGALTAINGLYVDCSNLLAGSVLCLPSKCNTYTVKANDTCYSISSASQLFYNKLLAFNPTINSDCSNLIAGENICLSNPAGAYTPTPIAGSYVTQTGSYASTSQLPPGPVATGTTRKCGKWYEAMTDDTCQSVSINQTITLDIFYATNPSLDAKCSNLIQGEYYCVQPMYGWNETSNATVPAPTAIPSGTTKTCYNWHTIVSGDNCGVMENDYGITMAQLMQWNPSLHNSCDNLLLGEAYCVSGPSSTSAAKSTTTKQAKRDMGSFGKNWLSLVGKR